MASRFHQRFAVRYYVTLDEYMSPDGESASGPCGLLFELSQAGCRISSLGTRRFGYDENVRIQIPGFGALEGRVRLASDGAVALRFQRPLSAAVLDQLVRICRGGDTRAVA
jgi:hypothetical protein